MISKQAHYVFVTSKPWNLCAFQQRRGELPGHWHVIKAPDDLSAAQLEEIRPRYIFFPHWSWRVPDGIIARNECLCFHMTDVPYGRGGSPLQNLILSGHDHTMMTALRMTQEFDAGPVYLKRPLSLAGSAGEIFERAADLILDMIGEIVRTEPRPQPQKGNPAVFTRRRPDQSELPRQGSIKSMYDFIRMLDAETYPHAFLDWGEFRLKLTDANLERETVVARVVIKRRDSASR